MSEVTKNSPTSATFQDAAFAGNVESLKEFIEMGVDVDMKNQHERTALHEAAAAGSLPAVEVLIAAGAKVNVTNKTQLTPLHNACVSGSLEIAALLLKNKADINADSEDGWTPLHAACYYDHPRLVEYLLASGANVNHVNATLKTPLMFSVEPDLFKDPLSGVHLINYGADVMPRDTHGMRAVNWACICNWPAVCPLLLPMVQEDSACCCCNASFGQCGIMPMFLCMACAPFQAVCLLRYPSRTAEYCFGGGWAVAKAFFTGGGGGRQAPLSTLTIKPTQGTQADEGDDAAGGSSEADIKKKYSKKKSGGKRGDSSKEK